MEDNKPDWESFGKAIMSNWPHGDVDGCELQDLAEQFNVIVPCEGGFDPNKHMDIDCVCPEKGDPWFLPNYDPS